MSHYIEKVTVSLENLISELARNPSLFLKNPDTDFSRNRKINFKTCVGITMNSGGCTLNKELLDFFDFDVNAPTVSAYTQQRAKILPEAFEYLFHAFTEENVQTKNLYEGYQLLACDGSNLTIAPNLNDPETLWKSNQLGATGNHLHLNALYDVLNRRIKYLADTYFDGTIRSLKLDEDFFKKIGCNAGIRMIPASRDEYLRAIRKYCGAKAESDYRTNIFFKTYISKKLDWSFNYEGFPDIFTDMTKEKSLSIARFLNPNAMNFDIQGELVAADDQHFSGKNVESMMAYSMLGLQLCYEKWIYIQGDPFPHTPLEIDKEDLLPEYKTAKRLMAILPFKEVKSALTEWLDANIDDKSDLNLIKHYLSDPEALAKVAKAMAKNEAQMEAKKNKIKSAKELIEQGDRKQRESGKDDMELEISPISEKGKLKREQNLDRQLADSMDNFISVARGLSFSSRPSNKEERIFLEQEYDGHCQICLKQIRKYNGEHYFEAINIIKFSKLPERLANSGKYGWNSLCLCPNCAAEYNYCSKKISSLYDQVMQMEVEPGSEETLDIGIEMPEGKARRIRYSPRHFMALKEAFKIFADEK